MNKTQNIKPFILLLFLALVTFSCEDNLAFPEEPAVELILKELDRTAGTTTAKYKFNELGMPTDMSIITPDGIIPDAEYFNYNSNNEIESWKDRLSFDFIAYSPFTFENGQLASVTRYFDFGIGAIYDFNYLTTSIEVDVENLGVNSNPTTKVVFEFSDNSYQQLISVNYLEGNNPIPNRRYEFQYNAAGNISNTAVYRFEDDSNQLELRWNDQFSYDDKINPFKRLFNDDPVLAIYRYALLSSNYSILSNAHSTPNNILSIDRTYGYNMNYRTYSLSYEYNEFNHPTASTETSTYYDVDTGEQNEFAPITKDYTYYEQ